MARATGARRRAPTSVLLSILLAILLAVAPRVARAQDPFEIQVYDSETAPPLEAGLEIHANYFGPQTGAMSPALAPLTSQVFHLTFEPHLGLTDWAEVGGYLQTIVRSDGSYDFAGAKLRFKARGSQDSSAFAARPTWPPSRRGTRAYSESPFGAELRPIVDAWFGRAYLSVNPILDFDLEGSLAGRPQLEPAAKAEVMVLEERLGLGVEYYAAIGPIDEPLEVSQQVHRLFGVLDLGHVPAGRLQLDFNLGVGHDLAAGGQWIFKSIIGVGPR